MFDNRGVGKPSFRIFKGTVYTMEDDTDTILVRRISGMAEDDIRLSLLDYLGWTEERELNVAGINLGGMIAQG
ncbi:hypothetical protein GALMADRAFT_141396 [Galerina marginata CBS 339.88]|uniref:Uncharacterized protein n=1 Tax=Galerina marginata (strain CBS 339.88) TaxID=685588 RepID=A0A067STX3_GALM3|nr:hypothetical protein GALMADRAFT_141396 [Galerina marginata CBS 339.88]